MDFGILFQNRMISVPFELEKVELGMLISGIPLPEKSKGMRPKWALLPAVLCLD